MMVEETIEAISKSATHNWAKTTFDSLLTLKRGQDLTRESFAKGTIPVAGSNGVIGYHNQANYKGPGITVGRSGSCGKVSYFDTDFWGHNTALVVSDLKGNDPKYIYYLLRHLNLGRFATGVSVPTLNRNVLRDIEVYRIPLFEQRAIARVLATVQAAIAKQDEIIQTTQAIKNALMHKLFTEGLNGGDGPGEPTKETEVGPVPEGFKVMKFEDFITLKRGKDLTKSQFAKGNTPVAGSNGIIGYHDKANYRGPGITVGRSGSCGKVNYYEQDFWGHNTALVVSDFKGNHPLFVYYYLGKLDLGKYTSGVSVPTLNRNDFKGISINVPSYNMQTKLASVLKTIDNKNAYHQTRKKTLESLFRTLLHELMTGQRLVATTAHETH